MVHFEGGGAERGVFRDRPFDAPRRLKQAIVVERVEVQMQPAGPSECEGDDEREAGEPGGEFGADDRRLGRRTAAAKKVESVEQRDRAGDQDVERDEASLQQGEEAEVEADKAAGQPAAHARHEQAKPERSDVEKQQSEERDAGDVPTETEKVGGGERRANAEHVGVALAEGMGGIAGGAERLGDDAAQQIAKVVRQREIQEEVRIEDAGDDAEKPSISQTKGVWARRGRCRQTDRGKADDGEAEDEVAVEIRPEQEEGRNLPEDAGFGSFVGSEAAEEAAAAEEPERDGDAEERDHGRLQEEAVAGDEDREAGEFDRGEDRRVFRSRGNQEPGEGRDQQTLDDDQATRADVRVEHVRRPRRQPTRIGPVASLGGPGKRIDAELVVSLGEQSARGEVEPDVGVGGAKRADEEREDREKNRDDDKAGRPRARHPRRRRRRDDGRRLGDGLGSRRFDMHHIVILP